MFSFHLELKPCWRCAYEFDNAGGCSCLRDKNCDANYFVPGGCDHCSEDDANEHCNSQTGEYNTG